jgi:SAM-dependent methyltransferase
LSHPEQIAFVGKVKAAFPRFFASARVLEVGSLDINGSVRGCFEGGTYIGLDVASGPGVDVVCQGQAYDAPDGSFDTVISCEAMEHNPHWQATMRNMIRVCRPGGLVLMTCASTGRKEHGTTATSPADSPLTIGLGWDYYRNLTARDFKHALPLNENLELCSFFGNWASRDLYMIGFRRGAPAPSDARPRIAAIRRHYHLANVRHGMTSDYLRTRCLIGLFGEERYWAGPIRPWQVARSKLGGGLSLKSS